MKFLIVNWCIKIQLDFIMQKFDLLHVRLNSKLFLKSWSCAMSYSLQNFIVRYFYVAINSYKKILQMISRSRNFRLSSQKNNILSYYALIFYGYVKCFCLFRFWTCFVKLISVVEQIYFEAQT